MAEYPSGDDAAADDDTTGIHSQAGSCCPSSSSRMLDSDSGSEDDDSPVQQFVLDEQELEDVTRQQAAAGRDQQGIPWDRLQISRSRYRQQRLEQYRNYMNCIAEEDWTNVRRELIVGWPQPTVYTAAMCPYDFIRNWRAVASSIVHFQLRNLLLASTAHDVFVVHDNRVQHWNAVTRVVGDVLDLRGQPKGPRLPGLGRVQVSTLSVSGDVLAAGGFSGELVLGRLTRTDPNVHWEEPDESDTESAEDADQLLPTRQGGQRQQQQQQQQQWQRQHQQQRQQPGPLWCDVGAMPQPPNHGVAQSQQGGDHQWRPQQPQRQPMQRQHATQQQRQHQCLQQQASHQDRLLGAAGPAAAEVLHSCRVTQSENGITNGLEIFESCSYGHCVMTSNNDCCVRIFDIEGCCPRQRLSFPFAVNYSTVRPDGSGLGGGPVMAVVGDDPLAWLVDCRSGLEVMKLQGHRDYSFAAAWHPVGHLLATGNQDSTTRVWDIRQNSTPLAVLAGRMGAIRSLRFSPDGAFLAAAEPADFVHVYNVSPGFSCVQEIDLFGEVAGIGFSPDAEAFFVAIADTLYSSLVQYQRVDRGSTS